MYRKIWILVISVILILILSAQVLAESNNPTWNLQDPLILIYFTRGEKVEGFNESFHKKLAEALPMMSIWGRGSLELLYKEYLGRGGLQRLMDSNTIFLVHPKDIKYLKDLETDYPNLLPLSYSKLKSYSFPLLYFSRDVQTDKIRGVIVISRVDMSLIELLSTEGLPLDTSLSVQVNNSTWNLQDPLILIYFTRGQQIKGFNEKFQEELAKTLPMNICGRGSLEALYDNHKEPGKGLQRLMDSNTIFLVHPKDIKYLKDLETDYPNLLPLSYSKLKSYPFPLLYFSRDDQTDKIRGIIIVKQVDVSLAELLGTEAIPLDTPLRYEKGQLKEIKEK